MDVASLLRCPGCRGPLERRGRELVCASCGTTIASASYLDMLGADGAGAPAPSSVEQRLMESELVARLYERVWRPAFVRLMAGGGAASAAGGFAGEFFLHKNAMGMDDRSGPWLDLSCGPGV